VTYQKPEEAARGKVVCPYHGITDCSPLLNGCGIVNWVTAVREIAFEDGRDLGRHEAETHRELSAEAAANLAATINADGELRQHGVTAEVGEEGEVIIRAEASSD
jgi:hypothetical protein